MSTVVESVPPQATSLKRPREEEADLPQPLVAMDNINTDLIKAEYAVRGAIVDKADQFARRLAAGEKLPFDKLVYCNIGNPQQLGQKPITFVRQVVALCDYPELRDQVPEGTFPADVVARSDAILADVVSSGAYTASKGALACRKLVAAGMEARDGFPADPEDLYMTDGASPAVHGMLKLLIRSKADAFLVPIPQYPLYSASIQLYGGTLIPYALDESKGWSMDIPGMTKVVEDARAAGKNVRAMVFINPGNPTGQCLSKDNLKELVKFAYDQKIILLCDEVYQENIYQDERPFVSARAVAHDMGEPYRSGLEMMCFHTVSKGAVGECGLRGGYVEMVNIHQGAVDEVYKIASINLSPNVPGQVAMSLMVNPPKPGMPSYEAFKAEKQLILDTLRERAHIMTDGFNSLEGVTCNFTEGAMYSFPQIRLSDKAMAAAAEAGKPADVFYCLKLLEATGISTVPGSGFGQAAGTFHLRTTILPPVEKMKEVVARLQKFHAEFMDQYR
mmetsp:Transcript_27160/g.68325  ORF Transcript_27160/g.68325 Transcript_27160/m.68325 type:complete len:504 (-) Transcript_27160:11-1522(-)